MHRHILCFIWAAAGISLSAPGVLAQGAPLVPAYDTVPTCADQGIRRVAVMVPPGQTLDQLRTRLTSGGLFPPATEVVILQPEQVARLRNHDDFHGRLRLTLSRFLRDGTKIDGSLSILLVLDASGVVLEAHPNTSNGQVNRTLASMWKRAQFEPYQHEGCRIPAWIHVPMTFSSDWELSKRRVEVRTGPPQR